MDARSARELLTTTHRVLRAQVDGSGSPPEERLGVLLELGIVERALASDGAQATLLAALDAAVTARNVPAERRALIELGGWLAERGDGVAGQAYLERALDAAMRAMDRRAPLDVAAAAADLAVARIAGGNRAAAELALNMAVSQLGAAPSMRARVELRSGDAARLSGDTAAAKAAYERARAAASTLEPLERAALEVALEEGLSHLPLGAPTAAELGATLDATQLAALVETLVAVARSPAVARPARTLDAALKLTGAAGGQVRAASTVLASKGWTGDRGAVDFRVADLTLSLLPKDGFLAPRDELVVRTLVPLLEDTGSAGDETVSARILGMLDRVLTAGIDLDRLVAIATDLAIEATGAIRGVMLLREPGPRLGYRSARSAGHELDDRLVASRTLVREAFLSGRPLLLADASLDPRVSGHTSIAGQGVRSVLVVPIRDPALDRTLGVLYLDDPGRAGRFGKSERDLAVGFAARLVGPLRAIMEGESERAAASSARSAAARPRGRPATRHGFPEIKGESQAIGKLLVVLDRAVEASAPVLVSGESGTGKELVARAIHRYGPRARQPFLAVSCSTIVETLSESELFGHAAGAFTGAVGPHAGIFERAHKGVVFLDELQDASPRLQAELLRVLESGEIRPVGGTEVRRIDVRIVAATNMDPAALVNAGTLREDLYYRLNVIPLVVPPLRERMEDVPELLSHLLAQAGSAGRTLEPAALERILSHTWPGNVRALRNCVERALVLAGQGPIAAEHVVLDTLPARPSSAPPPVRSVPMATVELNDRQLAVIARLRDEGEIRNAEHAEREGVTTQTAWRDLTELVAKGIVLRTGRGRSTSYRLAPSWESRLGPGEGPPTP